MMTMDYSNQFHGDSGADTTQSRTLSNHTESVARVNQARAHLAHKLRDRTTQSTGPVTWEHPPDSKDAFAHRRLPRSAYLRGRRNVVSASVQVRKDIQGTQQDGVSQSAGDWSQNMTLTQVHRLLKSRGNHGGLSQNAQSNNQLPDIRIKIAPVPEAYPSIKVTLGGTDASGSLAVFGNGMQGKSKKDNPKPDRSKSAVIKRNNDLASKMLPRMATTATSRQLSDAQILCNMDKSQMKCSEKIKNWMADNPLGAEMNADYEEELPLLPLTIKQSPRVPLRLDTLKRSTYEKHATEPHENRLKEAQKAKSGDALELASCSTNTFYNVEHGNEKDQTQKANVDKVGKDKNKKSVRFGSRDWVIKDSNYLFD